MIVLETPRLILRHLLPTDLDPLWVLYRDPRVSRYIPDIPQTYDETRKELEWHLDGHPHHPELGLWATIERETGRFIGRCGLLPWTIDGQHEVEVAFLIDPACWGRGLGSEAARAILCYGFDQLALSRLICLIDPQNRASMRVAERIGMAFEREGHDEYGTFWLFAAEKSPAAVGRVNGPPRSA